MKKMTISPFLRIRVFVLLLLMSVNSFVSSDDASVMFSLKKALKLSISLDWGSNSDPCMWSNIQCSKEKRINAIQIGRKGVSGTLPASLNNLTELQRLEVQYNQLTGPLPSLAGLNQLQVLLLNNNNFSSIPPDFFDGMSSLQTVELDYNPFSPWRIPESLKSASAIQNFSAVSANIIGNIPNFFGGDNFVSMVGLHLSFNNLEGALPASFATSPIQSLWINGQTSLSKLNGSLQALQNMTMLTVAWLHMNSFTGSLPDFSALKALESLSLRDNLLTGIVHPSLMNLPSLRILNLTNNMLQGPTPKFSSSVAVDMAGANSFCLPKPAPCDASVSILLSIAESMGYPQIFAQSWKGNYPCSDWIGITCRGAVITVINFQRLSLTGTISSNFSLLTSLQTLILSNNNLTGTIPPELTTLRNLRELDVSNNKLYGILPHFRSSILVKKYGNPDIGRNKSSVPSPVAPVAPGTVVVPNAPGSNSGGRNGEVSVKMIVGSAVAACVAVGLGFFFLTLYCKKRKPFWRVQSSNTTVIYPHNSGSDQDIKVTATTDYSSVNGTPMSAFYSQASSGTDNVHMIEAGNMVIPIHVLRNVTNNFSAENVLGRGGFGTVYKGELHDGTKIAVKRMESGAVSEKGLTEFKSEIDVLTKVRHRHLVALLGYCLEGNEKLLVYEYMPQGPLSMHLFNWREENLKPLEWTRRLSIALDVARGVEYLHSLAHQSFIHRDLKPSNILLGDDMRAKVADFGLVRLAPEGKASFETRLAGTFGYLAPEYAVTGRVTTKVDVFSFGVILMEVITGRKALDETEPEERMHLVTWFRRMHADKTTFKNSIDTSIDLNEDTLSSVSTVAELAGHCTAREPYQRPDMGHAVNVLSSLVELWKPVVSDSEDIFGIDFEMTLPQALKKWQGFESSSSSFTTSMDNTQTSIPPRPSGFAESFASMGGR